MEYRIPEPEEHPDAAIVVFYKVTKGFEFDDRVWDKTHFGRCRKAAKDLLQVCGTFEIAKRCLEQTAERFSEIGCDWSLETVLKHSHEWMIRRKGKHDFKSRERFLNALTQQRASGALEIKGTLNGAQMVDALGSLTVIPSEGGAERRIGNKSDGGSGTGLGPEDLEAKEA